MKPLSENQKIELRRIGSALGGWVRTPIDRTGKSKHLTAARRLLQARGLIQPHPTIRQAWKATPHAVNMVLLMEEESKP